MSYLNQPFPLFLAFLCFFLYAEFCTGAPKTNSTCATISPTPGAAGWFGIGGTSVSSPLWSAIIALWDGIRGERFGTANFGLYQLFRATGSYNKYFHDISGFHQSIVSEAPHG